MDDGRAEDIAERLRFVEKTSLENATAVERAAADAKAARESAAEVHPIVLARSGDEQRRDKFEKNVDQAHDRIRELDKRIVPLEKWKDRATWTGLFIGALGALIAWIVGLLKDFK
jgi:hypothetical protein